ncbi:MAG TPA: MEDS domain-containing protein [Nitrososphaerales archaeon]|nr:MEDS domain-containing protein [Nitrososphaerales archaeon]
MGYFAMLSPEVSQTLQNLTPGMHTILVYDSQENKREVAFNHLRYGIQDAELAYVCSEETPSEVEREMREDGFDVQALQRRKQLTVTNYDAVYFTKGRVYIPSIIGHFSAAARKSAGQGLKGLRAVGEMSCFIKHNKIDDMMEYEQALQRKFSFPAMGLCAFNVTELESSGNMDTLFPLLRAHGTIILTGPKGSAVLKPDEVQKSDVERVMKVKV